MTATIPTLVLVVLALPAVAQPDPLCFSQTRQCIDPRFRDFWENRGGLSVFGYPLAPATELTTPDGTVVAQDFERTRLEHHPDNSQEHQILLGRLGAEQLEERGIDWRSFPRTRLTGPGCRYFEETGHQICGRLLEVWNDQGLELYGLPLSDLLYDDGLSGRIVQYFERARFELHHKNAPEHQVQLGLLQREKLDGTAPRGPLRPKAYYFFPIQPPDTVKYGAYHHDYPATDMFVDTGYRFVSPTSGVVEHVAWTDVWNPRTNKGEDRGGLAVSVVGDDGIRYYGSHLVQIAEGIDVGVRVEAGQLLGLTGQTGSAQPTPPHLHFGISKPTTADDWENRRGTLSPFGILELWRAGLPLRPAVPWPTK